MIQTSPPSGDGETCQQSLLRADLARIAERFEDANRRLHRSQTIKDYADAEETYRALAESNVTEPLKEHAALLAASVPARAGNFAAAEKNLSTLIASLPKGSRQSLRAQIALGEAMVV